jgi:protein-disulfide isomerase
MLLGVVNTSFASATGLSLELDFLPAFTGDAVLYARSVAVDDFIAPIAPELGFIAEASDSQRALSVVDALTNAATGFDLPATNEAFGDGQALVIPSSEETTGVVYPGLDILFGAGNGVIALGTRGAAQAALTTEAGLADDPAFQAASEHFLNDTQVLLYLNSVPLFEALDSLIAAQLVPVDTDFAIGYTALSLIESASITGTSRADGVSMVRMAITLGEEPRPFQSAASTSIDPVLAAPYADIPQSRTADGAFVLGNPDARVTVVLFEDFLCPHCQNYQPEVQAFIERHVVTGEAKIEFRMVVAVDPNYSALAFQLAECSDLLMPGGFWAAHDQLFRIASASRFNDESVEQLATALGLNSADLLTCAKTAGQWQIDGSVAQDYGVIGTPTIAWRLDNGAIQAAPLSSRPTVDELSELVRQYLRSS